MPMSLRAARVNVGLSQQSAAQKIGISADTLGLYERGKRFPKANVINRITDLYGVNYDDIIFLPRITVKP